jgi:hypothetical protein
LNLFFNPRGEFVCVIEDVCVRTPHAQNSRRQTRKPATTLRRLHVEGLPNRIGKVWQSPLRTEEKMTMRSSSLSI